jgi:glycosyltransferase involved in cell wall biosynthesis
MLPPAELAWQAAAMPTGAAGDVSFVIPVYNKRPFLAGTIEGLARQRGDFRREFIFVDDGSTDGSRETLERLTAGWPDTQIIAQANCGPAVATNRGFAAARHPLIKTVDADDVLLPEATALLRDALLRHEAASLAFGDGGAVASYDEVPARLQQAAAPGAAPACVYNAFPNRLRDLPIGPSVSLLRAAMVSRLGGCDERVFTQDYSLFLRLAAVGPFVRLGALVALYPLVAADRVNDGGPQVLHDMNLALFHFLSEQTVPPAARRALIRRGVKRAWRWARRREDAHLLSAPSWLLLRAYLLSAPASLDLLRQSCAAFTRSLPVRVPSPRPVPLFSVGEPREHDAIAGADAETPGCAAIQLNDGANRSCRIDRVE